MKVIVKIEDNNTKIIYPGDNQDLNIMLYKLFKLIYSEVEFTLHHSCNREIIDLETFNTRKMVQKAEHNFIFDFDDV